MSEPLQLWDHQRKAIDKARGKNAFALFAEMGTGKTGTTIHLIRELYVDAGRLLRTLILCPPIVIQNWKREFALHSKIKPQHIVCLSKSGTHRANLMKEEAFLEDLPVGKILITNYEALLMTDVFRLLKLWSPEILICDESHRLKDPSSKRSKLTRELSYSAKYRYLLTGTPILNSPMDLFAQYRIMDGGKTFGDNFFSFRATYFFDKNAYMPRHVHFPNWILKPGALDQIREKIQESSMSIKKEECLTLPPLVRKVISVELGKEQEMAYRAMERDFIAFVGSEACSANLAITKALRLQQILSGFMPLGEGSESRICHFKDNPRLEAAKEIIEEVTAHSKILVWAVFKEDFKQLSALCQKLKLDYREIHGEITMANKNKAVDDFTSDPSVKVLIGHPLSGGLGINLVSASYALFYSRNFSLEQDLQAESRNHRGGSEIHQKITRIDLVAEETIDELILERLRNKMAIGEKVLKEMAKELRSDGRKTVND